MKKTQMNHALLAACLLVVSSVQAEEYPAANFQPKVIFTDESVVQSDTKTTPPPCVSQNVASAGEAAEEVDAKYPASHFQPKVIFSEAN